MFDPLDLYTAKEAKEEGQCEEIVGNGHANHRASDEIDVDDAEGEVEDHGFLDVLDLPPAYLATPQVLLCVLGLLQPATQVNFSDINRDRDASVSVICQEKHIPLEYLEQAVRYYSQQCPNADLNSASKICSRIPQMAVTHGALMLPYYTSVLKYYEDRDHLLRDEIIRQASLRIAESCGRSAQPSMTRQFTFDCLERSINIHEPSLTADNLGWKTWGSSFILSQKLINRLHQGHFKSPLRVLELGSGTGLAGISWLAKWVELHGEEGIEMFLTDLPEIISNLRKNADINRLNNIAKVAALDWTNPSHFIEMHSSKTFDVVIVSDPIYSPDHPELVVSIIERFLSEQGTCFLEIPARARYAAERRRLRRLLEDRKFTIIREEVDQGLEDWGMVEYLFLEIKHK
ncbi:hypothetical protein HG536_0F02080 [Torulaspora globosa]|uniref:Uncharacterized protein n=1 Tax=Torulaspora globosa TaxID=48254 RepID=A0A7G3ZK47_9SACH|nr:uncharacterized protein HG536_0F02080 [Torulaspora globosa]QLL33883.1 hypothetical protein HG536_0F02080 [Torulaspora globosa]